MTGAPLRVCIALVLTALLAPDAAVAQVRTSPPPGIAAAPSFVSWRFADGFGQDSVRISGVSQLAVPFSVFVPLGTRWAVDVAGAWMSGVAALDGGRKWTLQGPSDLLVRLVGNLAQDRLLLTLGATLPTGATGLSGEDLDAVRLLGAPLLRLPAPVSGGGFGATAGVVMARQLGSWALAFGTSYEFRGSFQPIETALAGNPLPVDLNPGEAMHLSLGADRLLGAHRLALLLGGDLFTSDRIASGAGASREETSYRLGPAIRALAALDLGVQGFREFSLFAQMRHRTAFTGISGQKVEGSSGTVLNLGVSTLRGRPRERGLIARADLLIDSGLEMDNTLASAGATIAGLTLGLSLPSSARLEPFVRLQVGRVDTGPESTSARALMVGLTWGAR